MTPERALALLARVLRVLTWPFVRYDIRGGACAPELKVGIIVVNHRSLFDVLGGLVCLHHFRRYPRLLIERRYVDSTLIGPFARAIGAIPVDRAAGGGHAFDAAIAALRAGVPILVMPEGKLHWVPDEPMSTGPAKTGVSRLATGASTPVVPAALSGTERVWPAGATLPRLNPFRRKTVVCSVADDPIWLTGDDHQANTDAVMAAIRELMV